MTKFLGFVFTAMMLLVLAASPALAQDCPPPPPPPPPVTTETTPFQESPADKIAAATAQWNSRLATYNSFNKILEEKIDYIGLDLAQFKKRYRKVMDKMTQEDKDAYKVALRKAENNLVAVIEQRGAGKDHLQKAGNALEFARTSATVAEMNQWLDRTSTQSFLMITRMVSAGQRTTVVNEYIDEIEVILSGY